MLQGKVVTIRKRARRMDDPHPELVSVVPGGSNQTPIRAMKADNIEEIDVAANLKRGDVAIARFAFASTAFKSEDEVRAWLTEGGYEVPNIVAVKGESFDGYSVASKEQPDSLVDIDLGNGVTAFVAVGVKAEDLAQPRGHVVAEGDAPVDTTISTGAQAKKGGEPGDFSEDPAPNPADQTTAAAEPAASATVATADAGVAVAQKAAVADPGPAPALLRVDEAGVPTIVAQKSCYDITELANLLQALAWAKDSVAYRVYEGIYTPEIASAYDTLIVQLGGLIQGVTDAVVARATKDETGKDTTAEQPAAPAAEAPAAEETTGVEPGEGGEATEAGTEAPAATAAKSDDPMAVLTAQVATMAAAITTLTEKVSETATKADEAISRVNANSGFAPARKSADVDDIAASSPQTPHQPAEKSESVKQGERNAFSLLGGR